MKFRKITAALLALIIMLSGALCACSGEETPDVTTDERTDVDPSTLSGSTLMLPYSRTDSFNPYEAETTQNVQIMSLLHYGLYSVSDSYAVTPRLAKGANVGKTTVNVTISSSAVFSDGSAVTADDVVESFNLAKQSKAYSERLSGVTSAVKSTATTVMFTLSQPDPYVLACLDFPVVRIIEGKEFPLGCGRYVASRTADDEIYLNINPQCTGFKSIITFIKLVSVNENSAKGSLEIGKLSFVFDDLSGGSYTNVNAKSTGATLNNFVYLGINKDSYALSEQTFRRAVNLMINRNEVVFTAFQGHAEIAYSPFNPQWYEVKTKDLTVFQNLPTAQNLIDESGKGYDNVLNLIVNKENPFKLETAQVIKKQLESAGLKVKIHAVELTDYKWMIENGEYDLYVGEVRLCTNMSLYPFFGGSLGYGIDTAGVAATAYYSFMSDEINIVDFVDAFNTDVPFIPLCYRKGAALSTNSLYSGKTFTDCDIYANIGSWGFTGK